MNRHLFTPSHFCNLDTIIQQTPDPSPYKHGITKKDSRMIWNRTKIKDHPRRRFWIQQALNVCVGWVPVDRMSHDDLLMFLGWLIEQEFVAAQLNFSQVFAQFSRDSDPVPAGALPVWLK